jgi:hypothetical protein
MSISAKHEPIVLSPHNPKYRLLLHLLSNQREHFNTLNFTMSGNSSVLGASSLATFMAASLSKDASPQLKSPTDAVAIACHAGMLAVGFRLVGLGEDDRIGE